MDEETLVKYVQDKIQPVLIKVTGENWYIYNGLKRGRIRIDFRYIHEDDTILFDVYIDNEHQKFIMIEPNMSKKANRLFYEVWFVLNGTKEESDFYLMGRRLISENLNPVNIHQDLNETIHRLFLDKKTQDRLFEVVKYLM